MVMYLDTSLCNHIPLPATCPVNRTQSGQKANGLFVDYLGTVNDVAETLEFDDQIVFEPKEIG